MSYRKASAPSATGTVRKGLAVVTAALLLTACGTNDSPGTNPDGGDSANEITIETNAGEKTVPVNPQRVAILDNTAMETLKDWGIDPVALPKPLLPSAIFSDWIDDDAIADARSEERRVGEACECGTRAAR